MGHDEHFLSRLERLAPGEVELSLSLYRDTAIVNEVVERAEATAEDRVALALSRDADGPHLVVTTRGAFVTCLGAGMKPTGHRVIPRAVLDAVMARRSNEELADGLAGGEGRGPSLLLRLVSSATMSREEFQALSAYQPALEAELVIAMLRNAAATRALKATCLEAHPVPPALLEKLWACTVAHGNYAVQIGLSGRAYFERTNPAFFEATDVLAWRAVRYGLVPGCLRALWASARLGKARLPRAKQLLQEANAPADLAALLGELTVLGLAHAKLEAEVRKVLERGPDMFREHLREFASHELTLLLGALNDPAGYMEWQLELGRELCVRLGRHLRPGAPYHFERPEDVPEALARAAVVNEPVNQWSEDPAGTSFLCASLPFVARASAEELYLPEAALVAWKAKAYSAERARALLARIKQTEWRPKPVRREAPKQSPNAPCPCGSGKKRKKCCGSR